MEHSLFWHRHMSLQGLISPSPFFTPLLSGMFSIVQTSTSYETAQHYLHHFLKGKIKSEGETELRGKMFHCKSVSQGRLMFRSPLLPAPCCHSVTTLLLLCAGMWEVSSCDGKSAFGHLRAWNRVPVSVWDKWLEVTLSSGLFSSFQSAYMLLPVQKEPISRG